MNPPPTHTHDQTEAVPVTLARLEGKVDAALAVQNARTEEHGRRLDVVDTRLNAHSDSLNAHASRLAAIPPPAPRMSPVQVITLILSGLAIETTIVLTLGGWIISRMGGAG